MEYVLIAVVILLTSSGQVLQKLGADRGLKQATTKTQMLRALLQWEIVLAVICLGTALVLWLLVLYQMQVSRAFPFISGGFIVVLLAARFILHETVSWWRWFGVVFIIAGISLIAQS